MKASRLLATFALGLSVASAWPKWLPEADSLMVRADDGDSTDAPQETPAPTSAKETDNDAKETEAKTTERNLNTATAPNTKETGTATGTNKSGSKGSSTKSASHKTYNAEDPAGSVVMVTPVTTTGTPIYKIKDFVTFGWSYTNLQGKPTAVDVLLSCSAASETWTLTSNMTFQSSASYVWDSRVQATAVESPLLTELYTLIIVDAGSSVSATPEAGYLAPFAGLTFGMYKPAQYIPLSEWHCSTCNAALGGFDTRAVGLALGMSAVTVLSFTWFVTGFGVALF
jgi:hypothetical protein